MDQLRYDCIGYAGRYPVKTPNMDRAAAMGTFFEHAYSPQPLCCPARQSMLTSRRPERDGLLWNYEICLKTPWLSDEGEFWTRELKKMGYRMAYIGKWHVSPEHTPIDFGYDYFTDDVEYVEYRSRVFPGHSYKNEFMGEIDPIPVEHSRTHWLSALAIEKLEKFSQDSRPWHIRVDFPEPHLPCRPCKEFAELYEEKDIPKWEGFEETFLNKPYIQKQQIYNWGLEEMTWEDWVPVAARYYAIISQVDDAIGRILAALEETGQTQKTLILITADHGDLCGSHRMMDKHYVMYDDVVHVPFIAAWPGVLPQHRREKRFVMNCLDIGPTILDICGGKKLSEIDGKSLLPLLKNEQTEGWREEVVSTYNGQQFGLYTQRMIRNKKWKYIWNTTDIDELYNLQEDPGELHNLIYNKENKELVSEMRKKLYEILSREGDGLVKTVWMKNQLLEKTKKL